MSHTPTRPFQAALLVLFVALLFPVAARAQSKPIDLTAVFRSSGVDIAGLRVYLISGIVLIRGTSADRGKVENAGTVARNLGYERVANLIVLTGPANDAGIVRVAEGRLGWRRELDGCKFHIVSLNGIVSLGGTVHEELQKDVAVELLRRIDGVKEVHSTLTVF